MADRVLVMTDDMLTICSGLGPWPESLTCAANAYTILRDLDEQLREDAAGRPERGNGLPHIYRVGRSNERNIYLRQPGVVDFRQDVHVGVMFDPRFGRVTAEALTAYSLQHGGQLPASGRWTG